MRKKEEDSSLVKRVQSQHCESSLKILIEKHSKLFYSVSNKFRKNINLEEIKLDKDYVIYRSAMTYNPDKGAKFSTWLGNMTKYYCLNCGKKEFKYVKLEEGEFNYFLNVKAQEIHDKVKTREEVDYLFKVLESLDDKRIVKIFRMKYLDGEDNGKKMTWKKIASNFNLTPQTIINLHSKGRRILKKRIKSKNLVDRI